MHSKWAYRCPNWPKLTSEITLRQDLFWQGRRFAFLGGKLSGINRFMIFSRILFFYHRNFLQFLCLFLLNWPFWVERWNFLFSTFFYKKTNGFTFFLKNSGIPRGLIFQMTFPKTEIVVNIEDNLMAETCLFSNIHFWDFLAETFKIRVLKGAWSSLYNCWGNLGGRRKGRVKPLPKKQNITCKK